MNHHESESWAAAVAIGVLGLLVVLLLVGGGAFWLYQMNRRARIAEAMAVKEAEMARRAEMQARKEAENARAAERMAKVQEQQAVEAKSRVEAVRAGTAPGDPADPAPAADRNQIERCLTTVEETWAAVGRDGELTEAERGQMQTAIDELRGAVEGALP